MKIIGSFVSILGLFIPGICYSQTVHYKANPSLLVNVLEKSGISVDAVLDSSGLYAEAHVTEPIVIDQIRMCGFTLWINPNGKKRQETGITYPVGYPDESQPNDPQRLQMILSNLPPFEISDSRNQFGYGEQGQIRLGSLPNPTGIEAQWTSTPDGITLRFFLPDSVLTIAPGQKIRIGYEVGVLSRPELGASDGVGIYGGNVSNPDQIPGSVQRQRLAALERYREFTVKREGWSKAVVLTEKGD